MNEPTTNRSQMDKLVRLSDAVDALRKAFTSIPQLVKAKNAVESIPAVDAAEVRHGHWIVDGYDLMCSECEELYVFDEYLPDLDMDKDLNLRYCPSCGARMDGRREDGDGDG